MRPDLPRTGADFDRLRLALALFQVIEVGAEELDGAVIDDDDVRSWRGSSQHIGWYLRMRVMNVAYVRVSVLCSCCSALSSLLLQCCWWCVHCRTLNDRRLDSTLMKYEKKELANSPRTNVPKNCVKRLIIIQQSFENDEGYRENNGYAKDTLVRDDSAFTTINLIGQGLREDTASIHQ